MDEDNDDGLMDRAISKVKSGARRGAKRTWDEMKSGAREAWEAEPREPRGTEDPVTEDERERLSFMMGGEYDDDDGEYEDDRDDMGAGWGEGGDPLAFDTEDSWTMGEEADDEYDDWLGGW